MAFQGNSVGEVVSTFLNVEDNSYINYLGTMMAHLIMPVKERKLDKAFCDILLRSNEVKSLFEAFIWLHRVHQDLHKDMRKTLENWQDEEHHEDESKVDEIAQEILKYKKHMSMYCKYCHLVPTVNKYIEGQRQNEANAEILKKAELQIEFSHPDIKNRPSIGWRFGYPIDMVKKYWKFLMSLKSFALTKALSGALAYIEDLRLSCDAIKQDLVREYVIDEKQKITSQLPVSFQGDDVILSDYGGSIREGDLIVRYSDHEQSANRHILLLDRVIIILMSNSSSAGNKRFEYKDMIDLKRFHTLNKFEDKQNPQLAQFSLSEFREDGQTNKAWIFQADTKMKIDRWIADITSALTKVQFDQLTEKGHKFECFTSVAGYFCDACRGLLRGKTSQAYRCPGCIKLVHKGCIPTLDYCMPTAPSAWLSLYDWYVGETSLQTNKTHLQQDLCTVGTFCVYKKRDGDKGYYLLVKLDSDNIAEVKIQKTAYDEYILGEGDDFENMTFDCIQDLVNYYKMKPLGIHFDNGEVITLGMDLHAIL